MVALGARNDGDGVDWKRTVTFLDLGGRICKRLLPPHSGHGDEPQLPNWHSDGDGFRRSRFVQNKSS